jgi:hypothetical protein
MTTTTTLDPDDPGPGVERTTVLAVVDAEARAVRRALGVLAGLRAPALAPLVRWTAMAGGVALTHRVPVDAVGLGSLRRAGPLRSGHVLAVGAALLEALDALHRAGLAHGAVDADAVLVGPDGGVVLGGCAAAWSVAPGEPGGPAPADDVAAVGELLRDLLGPASAPGPLVVALVRAVDPDVALRPDARSLLEALRRCGRPEPLLDVLWRTPSAELGDPDVVEPAAHEHGELRHRASEREEVPMPTAPARPVSPRELRPVAAPARRRPQRRRSASRRPRGQGRLFVVLGLAGAVIGTAYVVLAASGEAGPAASTARTAPAVGVSRAAATSVPAQAPGEDWAAVLGALDDRRTAALAAGSAERLAEVATGTAYAADLSLLRSIAASDARLEGGSLVLEDVAPVSVSATTAVLQVRDRRSAYTVVVGGTRNSVPERAARTWTITLVRDSAPSPGTWRVAEVVDAAISPAGRR